MPRVKKINRNATLNLNTHLANLLKARKEYSNKLKEIDKEITATLRYNPPSSNEQCLQIMRTALGSLSVDFEKSFIEYHRPGQSSLVLAQENRIIYNAYCQPRPASVTSTASTVILNHENQFSGEPVSETVRRQPIPDDIVIATPPNPLEFIETYMRNIDCSEPVSPPNFLDSELSINDIITHASSTQ